MYNNIESAISHFWNTNKKGLSFSIGISVLYVLPLILANIYYMDDMGRIMNGYSWSQADGRIGTSFLMRALSLNPYIVVNLYPYYTILSAAILAVSGYLLSLLFEIEKTRTIKLSSLLLIISPFYLSNLAFRYDSLPMTLSIFFTVVPFLFVKKSHFNFALITLICSYLIFSIYQPAATGIFIIGAYYILKYCKENRFKEAALFLTKLVIAVFAGLILWRVSVFLLGIDMWGRGKFTLTNPDFYYVITKQWNSLISLISSLSISYLFATSLFFILFGYAFICYLRRLDNYKQVASAILILLAVITSTFVINLVLDNPISSRIQVVYGFMLFFFASFFSELPKKINKLVSISFIFIIFYSFLLSSLFGQVLKNQQEYNAFIISLVSPHLVKSNNVQLHTVGTIGPAPRNEMMMRLYPILKEMTPIYKDADFRVLHDFLKFDLISHQFGPTLSNRESVLNDLDAYPIIDSNKFYTLRAKENIFILDFKKTK